MYFSGSILEARETLSWLLWKWNWLFRILLLGSVEGEKTSGRLFITRVNALSVIMSISFQMPHRLSVDLGVFTDLCKR